MGQFFKFEKDNRERALPAMGAQRNEVRPRNKRSSPNALVKFSMPKSSTSMIDVTLTNPAAGKSFYIARVGIIFATNKKIYFYI